MSLLQKLAKDLSSLAELHSLRKQLRTLQSVYELTVSDRDKKIADLGKQLEATKYYTNQYQKAFYRGIDYNDQLVEENESLKEQLQTAISNYDERDRHYTTLEAAHIKLGAELDKSEQEIAKLTREKETLEVEGTDFINVLRSNKEDLDNLKAEVQIAEDDFDEMANLYTNLHKAFDDLVDTNVDLAKKLRESSSYKIQYENIKTQLQTTLTERDKRDTEYKILSEQYDKLHKTNEAISTKIGKLELENAKYKAVNTVTLTEVMAKNEQLEHRISAFMSDNAVLREEVIKTKFYNSRLENELQTVKNDLAKKDKVISDAEIKYSHDQTQAMRAISRQQDELAASIVKYVSLTDKVKVVEGIVKELMPVSMRFQTALFDLIEVPNVSGT